MFSNNDGSLYGLKAGYEVTARTLALGLEAKYLTDFAKNNFFITPKIGLGVIGIVNVFYGFNIWTIKNEFSKICRHQFSIVCNLNRGLLKK